MRTSLVIPTLNGMPLLDQVLRGLEVQDGIDAVERIAIDSGSRDGTTERLRAAGFRVETIPQHEFDHGSTRDRAIGLAQGEVVILLTQDAVPLGRDWLPRMLQPFADPQVAGVWCRQVPRADCPPVIARRIRAWLGEEPEVRIQRLLPGENLADLAPPERLRRCAFDNVASAVRRSVWERFPLGPRRFGEDLHFGMRVIAAGFHLAYQPLAVVEHSHSRSAWAEGKRTFCDHRNLHQLVGLRSIPDWKTLRAALRDGTREHLAYVAGLGLPAEQHAAAMRWTRDYVRWQCWGQFLGARAGAATGGLAGWFYRQLGTRLERGIG